LFTWDAAAEKCLEAYREAMIGNQSSRSADSTTAIANHQREL
jgi:hypothetical protein